MAGPSAQQQALPVVDRRESKPAAGLAQAARQIALLTFYILLSAAIIRFNKHLMKPDVFPFSMALVSLHMFFSLCMCLVLLAVCPRLFPGMEQVSGRRLQMLQWFVPIGVLFALALYASNLAYVYCDVSFLQFIKENNVMICFLFSVAVGLQSLDRLKFVIIFWVVACSAFAVNGELHFVWAGFFIQLASQLAECARAVTGEFLLSGNGFKLDPLTYTLFSAPTCLAVLLIGLAATWEHTIVERAVQHWHLLVPNMLLAFGVNLCVATVIKEVSAVGFTMAGLIKDIVIVLVSAWYYAEVVTPQQAIGFAGTIMGIACWSYVKVFPNSTRVLAAERSLGLVRPGTEASALLGKPGMPDPISKLVGAPAVLRKGQPFAAAPAAKGSAGESFDYGAAERTLQTPKV